MNFITAGLLFDLRTGQIIRYRTTATLRQPRLKQYTALNEGALQNQRELIVKLLERSNEIMTRCSSENLLSIAKWMSYREIINVLIKWH